MTEAGLDAQIDGIGNVYGQIHWLNSSSSAFASCKSFVSNPSVNQL